MKKNKKWLVNKWTKERYEADVYDPMYQYISEFIADVNQLDEPEVLSLEWIKQKSINTHVDTLNGEVQVTFRLDDLQNLLVPKQELPVIPQFVANKLEQCKADGISVAVIFQGALNREYDGDLNSWILNNEKLFTEAFFAYPNIEVEEPKYIIDLDDEEFSDGNHYLKRLEMSVSGVDIIVGDSLNVMIFESEEEAQLIAEYIGGRVKELEE